MGSQPSKFDLKLMELFFSDIKKKYIVKRYHGVMRIIWGNLFHVCVWTYNIFHKNPKRRVLAKEVLKYVILYICFILPFANLFIYLKLFTEY